MSHEADSDQEVDGVSAVKREWGRAIREQRKLMGYSQQWLATKVGVDQSAVSYWEQGLRAPTIEKQLLIAQALRVSPRVLFQFPAAAA